MSEKRFEIRTNINGEHWLFDNKYDKAMMISKIRATLLDVCNMLNEQQALINELQAKLKEKEEDERLYANEILELRETNKEHIKFKSLGGNY